MDRITETKFQHESIVRYCDTDQMGVVYHTRYLDYWEWARTDFLKVVNLNYRELEELGFFLPVHLLEIKYHRAAKLDQKIVTDVFLDSIHSSKVIFLYKSYVQSELIVSGFTKHVVVNKDFKICKAPNQYIKTIAEYFHV
jgi:acyl-CoA thioester hydrolase